MIENIQEKTGKTLEEWKSLIADAKLEKHKEILTLLKSEYGISHGYANTITLLARKADAGSQSDSDLLDKQYSKGKEHLRTIYDHLQTTLATFGTDVELAPKNAYVSVRRKKQFAILQPSTKTRFDLGINLKGKTPEGRLEASGSWNAMCSHRVRIETLEQVDDAVLAWLREAYEAAG